MAKLTACLVALMLLDPLCTRAAPAVDLDWRQRAGLAQQSFILGHKALGGGVAFKPGACALAAPFLDRALDEIAGAPSDILSEHLPFWGSYRALCHLVAKEYGPAALIFERISQPDYLRSETNRTAIMTARSCLGALHQRGLGVPEKRSLTKHRTVSGALGRSAARLCNAPHRLR